MEVARKSSQKTKEIKEGLKSMDLFQLFESILSGDKSKIQKNVKKLKENENLLTTKEKINLDLAQFELNNDINQFFNNTSNPNFLNIRWVLRLWDLLAPGKKGFRGCFSFSLFGENLKISKIVAKIA